VQTAGRAARVREEGRPDPALTPKLERFLQTRRVTPFLVMDGDIVESRYAELAASFPGAAIHYAVKANPMPAVIVRLAALGARFDVSSRFELELCQSLGVPADRISHGNTIKKASDIALAFQAGVRSFVFDSAPELDKLARHAPGSSVMCRLMTSGARADWPLSGKFGCDARTAFDLLLRSRDRGLAPAGIAFHVGSQQTDPVQWRPPIAAAASVHRALARRGLHLTALNIGGGLPAAYRENVPPLQRYAEEIDGAITDAFGREPPTLMLEPGRALVADAGVIQAEVVLVARRSRADRTRWVYLDVGKFGGLAETLDESIRYRFRTSRGGSTGPVVLAGPTCDSADVLYQRTQYHLPLSLEAGDRIDILSASVGFNGFPPLQTYYV
jgi:ornithine decarboxylase